MDYNKIDYLTSLSPYALEEFAGYNYKKVYEYLCAYHPDVDPNSILIGTIFTCIATNGYFTEGEWNFVASFIGGYSYDEAFEIIGTFQGEDAKQVTKDCFNAFPYDIKDAYLNLCYAIMCVDGRVDNEEQYLLNDLL